MQFRIIFSLLLVAIINLAYGQKYAYHPKYITILDTAKGKECLKQCSRSIPGNVETFYKITTSDSLLFIKNFKKILSKKADDCCLIGDKLKTLDDFCYQLLGVMIGNKKFIYINAFSIEDESDLKTFYKEWKTDPIVICDGGTGEWGALFNPVKQSFSQLSFNGVG